uniref:Putative secreted protein n=1 Tax=Amblyomma parvum TaxID=251391 RepID=A0A023G007_AMBPA
MMLSLVLAFAPLFAVASSGNTITKERFLQAMKNKNYWTFDRSYEDLIGNKSKMCISTKMQTSEGSDSNSIFSFRVTNLKVASKYTAAIISWPNLT